MSPIVEVVIGLVFVFSLLSILVTQINTFILNVLNLRAKQLKEGLERLIVDKELQAKILAHPLIRMVEATVKPSQPLTRDQARDIIATKPTQVSYIQPSTFVEALISLLTADGRSAAFNLLEQGINALPESDQKYKLREMLRDVQGFGNTGTNELRSSILELEDETHKQILSYALEDAEQQLGRASVRSGDLIPLLEGVRKVRDQAFQDALRTILVTARNLQEARGKLENWFNDGMARVTEIYKRKIQLISLIVGLALAVVMNIDTLQLAQSLWTDPTLRSQLAATARANVDALGNQIDDANQQQQDAQQGEADPGQAAITLEQTVQQLLSLQLPIGWEFTPVTPEMIQTSIDYGLPDPRSNLRNAWNLVPGNSPDWLGNVIRKLIGWLATMVAVAQGAPFWFDLLRRLTGGSSSAPASTVTANPTVNVTVNGREFDDLETDRLKG
jgi:hypothetical protein